MRYNIVYKYLFVANDLCIMRYYIVTIIAYTLYYFEIYSIK